MIAALSLTVFVLAVLVAAGAVLAFKDKPSMTVSQVAWVGVPVLVAILSIVTYRSVRAQVTAQEASAATALPTAASTVAPTAAPAPPAAAAVGTPPARVASPGGATAQQATHPPAAAGVHPASTKPLAAAPAQVSSSAAAVVAAAPDGKALFVTNCAACHQATGLGIPGTFPPLAGSEVPNGPPQEHIQFVLGGHTGPLKVQGKLFNGVMPAFKGQLSAVEVAAILTYERTSWGNHGSRVTAAMVKSLGG